MKNTTNKENPKQSLLDKVFSIKWYTALILSIVSIVLAQLLFPEDTMGASFKDVLNIIAVFFFIIFLMNLFKKKKKANSIDITKNKKPDTISEERIIEIQESFENKLEETNLPDAIDGKEIYIYKNLMRPWYNKLSSKYRYDDDLIQKIRNDWIDYMKSLEDRNTYNFLSLESENENKSEKYRQDHIIASKKVIAIEDGFASKIGTKAIDELNKTRKIDDIDAFNDKGGLAPKGFKYDLEGKLVKE